MHQRRESRPIAILGAGGYAREVLWLIRECNAQTGTGFHPSAFIDDVTPELQGISVCGLPVRGWEWFERMNQERRSGEQFATICGVGSPRAKIAFVKKASKYDVEFISFIHPTVRLAREYVHIGKGCSITAGCIITTQVKIGDHVSLNLATTVGHDSSIGDYSNLAPGTHVSGNVQIGIGVDIGTGATIIPGVRIGNNSIIGAQACVVSEVQDHVTAVGVPARAIKGLDPTG